MVLKHWTLRQHKYPTMQCNSDYDNNKKTENDVTSITLQVRYHFPWLNISLKLVQNLCLAPVTMVACTNQQGSSQEVT